jgi:polyphenol oxidase
MSEPAPEFLWPDWPVAPRVRAAVTLRPGGVSCRPYESLNLAAHVEDRPADVAENRRRVRAALSLPMEPLWLAQVHGTRVVDADAMEAADAPQADGAVTRQPGRVLAVMVADCLPVLLARRDGAAIAIAHAGWRGLAAGVLESAVAALRSPPEALCAWLGPAIGPAHFEVGAEVRTAFCDRDPGAHGAFAANARGRWQCDLAVLARRRLVGLGLTEVHGDAPCTFSHPKRFYSYRREPRTGRFAALLWIAPNA